MEKQDSLYGLDYLTKLSYAAVDRSDADEETKRNLLFSLYSFRCLFDNLELVRPSKVLYKHKCCFYAELSEHPDYASRRAYFDSVSGRAALLEGGGVQVNIGTEDKPVYKLKFDAGSELWAAFVRAGKITGEGARLPEKFSLYETALACVTLPGAGDEVKAMWYIFFPYIVMIEAPHEPELYDRLKEALQTEQNYERVLASDYSDTVFDSPVEMVKGGVNPIICDWYLPYVVFKNERTPRGCTREADKYYKRLALREFPYVFKGTEKLLDSYPDDIDYLILNVAARVGLCETLASPRREEVLAGTVETCCDMLARFEEKRTYILYYRGLAKLGLRQVEEARADFEACLEEDGSFELAAFMLRAMSDEYLTKPRGE